MKLFQELRLIHACLVCSGIWVLYMFLCKVVFPSHPRRRAHSERGLVIPVTHRVKGYVCSLLLGCRLPHFGRHSFVLLVIAIIRTKHFQVKLFVATKLIKI